MFELLSIALLGTSSPPACPLPFEVVPNEAAARKIAAVAIASAPPDPRRWDAYALTVSYVKERRSWIVVEGPIPHADRVRMLGGGGFGMEIAACDGAVSDINIQI